MSSMPRCDRSIGQDGLDHSRRAFLAALGALSLAAAVPDAGAQVTPAAKLPQMQLGKYSISRLVCGANPFNAGSHLSVFVNHEMRQYYTPEQILKTLRRCEQVGINCWQSSGKNIELYQRLRDEGSKLHYLSLGENFYGNAPSPAELAKGGCIAIAHHGEASDQLFKRGQFEKVGDYLKQVHDAGLLAGISTHMPAVVDAAESKGLEVDYYMTCVYERHRSAEDLKKLLGYVPIPVGEVYLREDPPRMFSAIQKTRRPCLAFKILAAGRLSERKEWVEQAFKQAYESIKPGDGVIIGLYDKHSDQAAEDAGLALKFGGKSV